MTGIIYCDSLKKSILLYLLQDVDLRTRIDLWFILDGAPYHFLLAVCVFLKSVFLSNR